MQDAVAAIALTAPDDLLQRQAQTTRVAEAEHIGPLHHQDGHPPRVVGMHQSVDQRFAQGHMHRRVILPLPILQAEGHLEVCHQLTVNAAVKLEQIA